MAKGVIEVVEGLFPFGGRRGRWWRGTNNVHHLEVAPIPFGSHRFAVLFLELVFFNLVLDPCCLVIIITVGRSVWEETQDGVLAC